MQALEHCNGRTLTGIVVSDKKDKTIVVRVETLGLKLKAKAA